MASKLSLGDFYAAVPYFLIPGIINVASQAVMVRTLKLGHNGLSVAIRNCAGLVPFSVGVFFLGSTVKWFNSIGLLIIITAFIMIALSKKNNSSNPSGHQLFSFKWLLFAAASTLLSGTFQTFNTLSTVKFNYMVKSGMATPLLMSCCAFGYITALLLWQRDAVKTINISGKVWRYAVLWAVLALLSYFFMFKTLDIMRSLNAAALVFPTIMGINVSCFFIYSKFKLREPYTLTNICCLIMCLLGVILLSLR
jgi:uncharacterized membrane protein